jgi:Hypervirulence associated proteins TUDOR domain
MAKKIRIGDRVSWQTPQGATVGTVERVLTGPFEIEGHHVAASKANPQYLVQSEKTGARAAHRPEALEPVAKGDPS